jgi:RNA polymerase sigma-70 factor (ECF subfamily)
MRRGECEPDATDLVKEAWLRLLEYSEEKTVHSTEAYMDRTANALAIDRHRQRQLHVVVSEDAHPLERLLPLVSPVRNPHGAWVADQRLSELRGVLNERLQGTGDIFVLHRAGFSYKELAVAFKLSESAIEKHIALSMLWLMDRKEQGCIGQALPRDASQPLRLWRSLGS